MGRNTVLLKEIVSTLHCELDDLDYALDALESHFHDRLLVVDIGNTTAVATMAAQLRLSIIEERMFQGAGSHRRAEINDGHRR